MILTDIVPNWPCFKKWSKEGMIKVFHACCGVQAASSDVADPSLDHNVQEFGNMQVNINQGITMSLENYFSYSGQAVEENPMYLFDSEFGEKRPDMLDDYTIPKYFQEDFFSYLEEPHRPSFRWILVGPTRSGNPFLPSPSLVLHGPDRHQGPPSTRIRTTRQPGTVCCGGSRNGCCIRQTWFLLVCPLSRAIAAPR